MKSIKPELKDGFNVIASTRLSQYAEMVLGKGSSTGGPDNKHEMSDQWMYIVSGEAKAIVNKKEFNLKAGGLLLIEAGETHEIINTGSGSLKTINFYAPPEY